jgi:hypothetical protein
MLALAALPIAARAADGGAARNGGTKAASSQPPASAATTRTLREADRLFAQGHYAEVRKLIAPLLKMAHPHPEALFLSGRLHLVHRQWTAAANDFRRMLQVNPNLPRVRLELARALYLAGDYQAAEYHFLLLTGQHLPPQVLKNVQYFLKQIREKAGYWGASVAIVPDTNSNQATSAQTVVIDGQTFTLLDNARQKSGVGLYVSAQGRRNFGSGLRNYVRGYTQLQDYRGNYADFFYLRGALGHVFSIGNATLDAEVGLHGARYQGALLYDGLAARAVLKKPLRDNVLFVSTLDVLQLRYAQTYDYHTGVQSFWVNGARIALSDSTLVNAEVIIGASTARNDAFAFHAAGGTLGATSELSHGITLGAQASLLRSNYLAPDPFFGQTRGDTTLQFEASIQQRAWHYMGFSPRLVLSRTINSSNIPFYSYTRTLVQIALTRNF